MKKKTLCALVFITMAVGILLALTGCGKSDQSQTNNDKQNQDAVEQESSQTVQAEGESGSVVKYKGNTYYWKLTDDSRSKTAVFANYKYIENNSNELVKVDENGNEGVLLKDKGSGDIFIVNDRIFLSSVTDEYGLNRNIYSVDLNGEDKKEYSQGDMKYIIGDYIICQMENNKGIFRINTKTDQIENLRTNAKILNCIDEVIYYEEDYNSDDKELKIGSITDNNDNGIIAKILSSDFKQYNGRSIIEVTELWKENDRINMYVGYRDGTANLLQELLLFKMDKDGKNMEKEDVTDTELISTEDEQLHEGVYIRTIKQDNNKYAKKLVYIDESTKERKDIISQEELNSKFNFKDDDEHMISLYTSSIVGDDIYVMLDYSEHYSAEDMGWRYAYKRLKTVFFKYNIKTNDITTIYEF